MEKKSTRNANINTSDHIFISCTKGKGIKISPIYVRHDTQPDHLYYKVELQKRDDSTGKWGTIHGDEKWNINQDGIEKLFDFITATTELKTKEVVSILDTPAEQVKAVESLIKEGKLAALLKHGLITDDSLSALQYTIRISEIEQSISELEYLLASSDTEKDFENWCNKNIWAFGNYYVAPEEIHSISNAEKVDLLVKNAVNCYRDIIEFKKPSFSILDYDASHCNYYFAKEASKAISQVMNYSDVFSNVANQGLHRHEEIMAYYPKSIIVIGRTNSFNDAQIRALHGLNSRLNGIIVKSYDDILAQAKNLLSIIIGSQNSKDSGIQDSESIIIDDDLPF